MAADDHLCKEVRRLRGTACGHHDEVDVMAQMAEEFSRLPSCDDLKGPHGPDWPPDDLHTLQEIVELHRMRANLEQKIFEKARGLLLKDLERLEASIASGDAPQYLKNRAEVLRVTLKAAEAGASGRSLIVSIVTDVALEAVS